MRTRTELERLLLESPPLPRDRGRIDLLVIRRSPGEHETPARVEVTREHGMAGDRWDDGFAWMRDPDRQLTLMMTRVAELVCDGQPLHLPGDNLLVSLDLGPDALPIGSRLRAGEALIEVTRKPHNGCKKFLARFGADALEWVNDERGKARKLRGVNCRVIEPGIIGVGDSIEIVR